MSINKMPPLEITEVIQKDAGFVLEDALHASRSAGSLNRSSKKKKKKKKKTKAQKARMMRNK